MATLSSLALQQRSNYDSKIIGGINRGTVSHVTDLQDRALEVETPDEESFESRSNFLKGFAEMERYGLQRYRRLKKTGKQGVFCGK